MIDPRNTQLAEILALHSIKVKSDDKVLIKATSQLALPLAREVYKQVLKLGGFPHLVIGDEPLSKFFYDHAQKKHLDDKPVIDEYLANWSDKSVIIVGENNTRELAEADNKKLTQRAKATKTIRDKMLEKPWILTYVPTPAMAQDANMSTDDLEDFYFNACILDWSKQYASMKKLADSLTNAKKIEVVGDRTHLTLSAKGRIFIPCAGEFNMPDGEVFTAPVDDSVEGYVYFNYPLLRQGKMIRDIQLYFEKGVVVRAQASENQDFLEEILNTDAGARRLGEFAIGLNPGVKRYMYNILFDEKMSNSIHMALGAAYKECNGKNESAIHMDIVKDMRPEGSTITVDGKVLNPWGN